MSANNALPQPPAGHCKSALDWQTFAHLQNETREQQTCGHLSDFEVANAVFLAGRTDRDLVVHQTAAKERIRWLSVQLAKALAAPSAIPEGKVPVTREFLEALVALKGDAANGNNLSQIAQGFLDAADGGA